MLLVLHAIVSMVEVLGGGKAAEVSSKTFCACTCCDPVWGASADTDHLGQDSSVEEVHSLSCLAL